MRSVGALAAGLFAEVVAVVAFYGIAQTAGPSRLLAFLFLSTLALIGARSTYSAGRNAMPGIRRDVVTLASAAIFTSLVVYAGAALVSLQAG